MNRYTSALIAVVEALRLNPDRYAVIYNTKYDDNDSGGTDVVEVPSSSSSSSSSFPYPQTLSELLTMNIMKDL
jgi:hypothetical protein